MFPSSFKRFESFTPLEYCLHYKYIMSKDRIKILKGGSCWLSILLLLPPLHRYSSTSSYSCLSSSTPTLCVVENENGGFSAINAFWRRYPGGSYAACIRRRSKRAELRRASPKEREESQVSKSQIPVDFCCLLQCHKIQFLSFDDISRWRFIVLPGCMA